MQGRHVSSSRDERQVQPQRQPLVTCAGACDQRAPPGEDTVSVTVDSAGHPQTRAHGRGLRGHLCPGRTGSGASEVLLVSHGHSGRHLGKA